MSRSFLVAIFADAGTVLNAVAPLRQARFRIDDVFSPFPIHGLDQALQRRRTRLPVVTLVVGLTGLALAIALQAYTNLVDWPMNVGGKPDNSALAFIPICFELTVLLGGLGTVAAFFLRVRLFPGKRPRLPAAGITDDRFALVLRRPEDEPEARRAWRMLEQLGALEIEERRAPS